MVACKPQPIFYTRGSTLPTLGTSPLIGFKKVIANSIAGRDLYVCECIGRHLPANQQTFRLDTGSLPVLPMAR